MGRPYRRRPQGILDRDSENLFFGVSAEGFERQ
jgi:hypothetical protein